MDEIPTLSMHEPGFADSLIEACAEVGFVSVRGHGMATAQFDRMRALCQELFDLPDSAKQTASITRENYRGFIPLGFFTPNRGEVTGTAADQYEGYKLHWECPEGRPECRLYGPNRWMPELPHMRATVLDYWAACDRLAGTFLTMLAPFLGVDAADLHRWHVDPLTNMTLLHYPQRPPATVGIHPHKDTNVLTFLHPDPVGGLQVRSRAGAWMDADPPPDALLVNTGEMLELWSGGRLPATAHRVTNPAGAERYSFPWFLVPNHRVRVEPLLPPLPGFRRAPMPVGALSAEVWRTNWPDQAPSADAFDLGSLDR